MAIHFTDDQGRMVVLECKQPHGQDEFARASATNSHMRAEEIVLELLRYAPASAYMTKPHRD